MHYSIKAQDAKTTLRREKIKALKMMKGTVFIAALAATVIAFPNDLVDRAGCGGDNCFNQVSATRFGAATLEARLADCASYLEVTETPAVSTVVTTIATSTTTIVAPDVVPAYASGCAGNDLKYRSACSCANVAAQTVTAKVPVVTQVVQIIATERLP
ncbi:hypothetical protein HJFPF1_02022 [Paramyrothecium foliicola]|nr:hypothetical protein HJFPF1_02022 [Paramyrothecium foliicola]